MTPLKKTYLIRYGELALKGGNRSFFLRTLISNLKYALRDFSGYSIRQIQGRITVDDIDESREEEFIRLARKVFGISYISAAYETEADIEEITKTAVWALRDTSKASFKVESRRGDKSFALTSPEISQTVGAAVLRAYDGILSVDVHNPDITLTVEVRKKAYIYYKDIPCENGLPVGCSGKGAVLLSGGIDSPAASWLMSRRGMKMTAVHFHSYPYTSLNAQQKVLQLTEILAPYNCGMDLYLVEITKIQEQIIKNCNDSYLTILLRRAMFRIAQIIARRESIDALVTGESLGQVASQTVESINCTNELLEMPVFRPLIGNDKNEIVLTAKKIQTFEISILPYEDCCTIFVPKHPQTKPDINKVLAEESKLETESLINEAAEKAELIHFD